MHKLLDHDALLLLGWLCIACDDGETFEDTNLCESCISKQRNVHNPVQKESE